MAERFAASMSLERSMAAWIFSRARVPCWMCVTHCEKGVGRSGGMSVQTLHWEVPGAPATALRMRRIPSGERGIGSTYALGQGQEEPGQVHRMCPQIEHPAPSRLLGNEKGRG